MNETAGPAWAPGLRSVEIKPHAASFITFFPERDATPSNISWADHLVPPRPTTRLPAWCRVAVEAHPSTLRTGLIMKRISLQRYRALGTALPAIPVSAETTETGEDGRRVRARLSSFEPSDVETTVAANAPSQAEIVSSLLKAKVAVANHYYKHITIITAEENMKSRTNRYFRTVPRKRPISEGDEIIERDDVTNGNRLRTYAELAKILGRAAEGGAEEINLSTASSAEASAALLQSGRDPRVSLAAKGVPDLSIITDMTELPKSPLAISKLPSAKSPVKRLFGLSSPIKTPTKRLAESIVPLLPGSSPKASPSPTKSSTPSTPYKESPRIIRLSSSPAGFPKSPILMRSPLQKRGASVSPIRGSLFETPSKPASSSAFLHPGSASARDTPTKRSLTLAITPSKRSVLEPTTPYQIFTPRAATPSQSESPLGLMASLPFYFQAIPSPTRPVVVGDVNKIDFGASSPSFAHASWLQPPVNAGEIQRSKNVSKALRRRSEPLARSLHKAKIRKRSMSPQKLNSYNIDASIASLQDDEDETIIHHTALDVVSEDAMAEDEAFPSSPIQPKHAAAIDTPSKSAPNQKHNIVEVDMHKNQDIFGTQKGSPAIRANPAIEELARIAQDRCNGGANVKVSQDDDRLFVRFKLPTKFAPMFPENRGDDESRFLSSPSLSTSPRLRFKDSGAVSEGPANDEDVGTCQRPLDTASSPNQDSRPLDSSKMTTPSSAACSTSLVETVTTLTDLESPVQANSPEPANNASSPSRPETSPSAARVIDASAYDVVASTPPSHGAALVRTSSGKQASVTSSVQGQNRDTKATNASSPIDELSSSKPADESPSRARMQEIIKRPRAKRLSSSNQSLPTVTPRQPLVVKSPNAESVPKASRKLDSEDTESGMKMPDEEVVPKKASNFFSRLSEHLPIMETPTKTLAALASTTQDDSSSETEDGAEDPDADELGMEFSNAPTTRRSTRLRGKSTPAKSSIPVPGKAGRGKAGMGPVRNEQQELSRQTLANTRRNKGKAVSAKKALERLSDEVHDGDNEEPESEETTLKGGKSVVWKDPLAAYTELSSEAEKTVKMTDKPKRGRGASKATAGAKTASRRVVKAARKAEILKATIGPEKHRTVKAAAAVNRNGSGTPARVTRSQART